MSDEKRILTISDLIKGWALTYKDDKGTPRIGGAKNVKKSRDQYRADFFELLNSIKINGYVYEDIGVKSFSEIIDICVPKKGITSKRRNNWQENCSEWLDDAIREFFEIGLPVPLTEEQLIKKNPDRVVIPEPIKVEKPRKGKEFDKSEPGNFPDPVVVLNEFAKLAGVNQDD
jgi:hypothetical protein